MGNGGMRVVEWWPRQQSPICAFTVSVGEATALRRGLEHNANWAVAHGVSFTLFLDRMTNASSVHPQWEKVAAAQQMLARSACHWLMHVDADAVVAGVHKAPSDILAQLRVDAVPAAPIMFTTCNSPLGHGTDCDVFCCGRARDGEGCCARPRHRPSRCTVGLHDFGVGSPYPCMINSGVWFLKNTPRAHTLVQEWLAKQGVHGEIFGEQASLNELKEAHPHLIDVVGAQVMNTPVAFHRRMLRSGDVGRAAFDIALRHTSGFEPAAEDDKRLNQSVYRLAATSILGGALGSGDLRRKLNDDIGECAHDPTAFICHPFARPVESKAALAEAVAASHRQVLEQRLRTSQQLAFRTLAEALGEPAMDHTEQASVRHKLHRRHSSSSSSSSSSTSSDDGSVDYAAVCIAGALRTFLQPVVQQSFVTMLHRPGYEYCVQYSAGQTRDLTRLHLPLTPTAPRSPSRWQSSPWTSRGLRRLRSSCLWLRCVRGYLTRPRASRWTRVGPTRPSVTSCRGGAARGAHATRSGSCCLLRTGWRSATMRCRGRRERGVRG